MREFGEVRKDFGEDNEAAAPYVGQARTLLGVLKNRMERGGLSQLTQTTALPDGAVITVSSIMGQDTIRIAPPATPASTETTPDVEIEQPVIPDVEITFDYEVPVQTTTPGTTEYYSPIYRTGVLLGAVMDKTTKVTYLAYAAPFVDQTFGRYQPGTVNNQSQLVALDKTLTETSRTLVAQPDWGGQLTYDYVTDSFFMNVWTASDPRYSSTYGLPSFASSRPTVNMPHRSLIQITKNGATATMSEDALVTIANNYSNAYLWGDCSYYFGNGWLGTAGDGIRYAPSGDGSNTAMYGNIGTSRYWQQWPLSQPSTSGLIAVMFQGGQAYGDGGVGWSADPTAAPQMTGYAFVWSTVSKSIVWKGLGIASSTGVLDTRFGRFATTNRFDQWATITPAGDAILGIDGVPYPVTIGGSGPPTPPTGTLDVVVTRKGLAYAITATGGFVLQNGSWTPLVFGGTPRSVLHDLVTDAVAIVLNDASGAWIYNGTIRSTGAAVSPFKLEFSQPPTKDSSMFYPQQFINGSILITYALPWDGTRGTMGSPIFMQYATGGNTNPLNPAGPRGMAAHYWTGQHTPAWRAQLGRVGMYSPANGNPSMPIGDVDCAVDGSIDPFQWQIGRYDIPQLQVSL
jgi:hypothetical protein